MEKLDAAVLFGLAMGGALGAVYGTLVGEVALCIVFGAPIGGLLGLAVGIAAAVLKRKKRRDTCPKCGYSTKGLPSATCPECGADVTEGDAAK